MRAAGRLRGASRRWMELGPVPYLDSREVPSRGICVAARELVEADSRPLGDSRKVAQPIGGVESPHGTIAKFNLLILVRALVMPGGPLWDAGDSQRLLLRAHESSTLFSSATLLSGDLSSDSYDSNAASSTSTSRVPWLLQLDDFFDATEAAALVRAGDEAGFDAAAEQSYSKATGRSGRTPLSASRRNSSAAKVTIDKLDAAAASHVGNVVGRLERLLGAPRSHFEGFLVAAHVKCDCEGPSARFAFSTRLVENG